MNENDDNNEINENQEKVKKQKAGLNAVRPDDYVEQMFKGMAKDNKLSQTEMFNRIFWNYIRDQNDERKQLALNLESEINLISNDLNNILKHFKSISDKAQETIISIKTNAEQTEKNLSTDVDTLQKKIEDITNRNKELELLNSTFVEVKSSLESQLLEIIEANNSRDSEIKEAKEIIKSKDKLIKDMEKNINLMEKNADKSDHELFRLQHDVTSLTNKIKSLESTNDSLNNTINTIDILKKSEISSVESKYKLIVEELESRLNRAEELKEKELQQTEKNLKSQYESDKKMAIADIKIELAELKSKYGETLIENANLQNR